MNQPHAVPAAGSRQPDREQASSAALLITAAIALGLAGCGSAGNDSPAAAPPASSPAGAGTSTTSTPATPATPATPPASGPVPSPTPSGTPSAPPVLPVATGHCEAFPNPGAGAATGDLASSVTNTGGGLLRYDLVSQPAQGTVSLDGATGRFSYTPNTNARGYADTFAWRVTNAGGGVAQASAKVVYGTPRIMPLGDSITHGVVSFSEAAGILPAEPMMIAYRLRLQQLLANGGYAFDFVGSMSNGSAAGISDGDHEGHSGFTSFDIDSGIGGWIASASPDIVLLHIGTNDHAPGVSGVDGILSKLGAWASSAANRPVKVALAKIIDQRPDSPEVNAIDAYNANLEGLYSSKWADGVNANSRISVRLTDMRSAIDPDTDMTPITIDNTGLHPTNAGFGKMAQVWYDTMVREGFVSRCP